MQTVETGLPVIAAGLTKTQIAELARFGVDYVLEAGKPELVAEQISVMEAYIKAVKEDRRFTEYVRDELAKNGGKLTTASGAKLESIEAGVTYDYSACGDWLLAMREQELLAAKNAVDERKKFLRNIPPAGIDSISPEGEVLRLYPPAKTSNSTYRVTLAR